MNARYYDSSIGRFVSEDSAFWDNGHLDTQLIDPQSWNSYAYARNNPLAYNDLGGQWPTLAQVNKYNPLNILFGADTDRLSTAIASGNKIEGAKAVGNIALTTALVVASAADAVAIAADAASIYRGYNRYQVYQQELADIEAKTAARNTQIQASTQGKLYGGFGNYIPEVEVGDLPESVQSSFQAYVKNGWKERSDLTTKPYRNQEGYLPSGHTYTEFDVNPKTGPTRDAQRFFKGSDGRVYYTDTHTDPSQGNIVSKIK